MSESGTATIEVLVGDGDDRDAVADEAVATRVLDRRGFTSPYVESADHGVLARGSDDAARDEAEQVAREIVAATGGRVPVASTEELGPRFVYTPESGSRVYATTTVDGEVAITAEVVMRLLRSPEAESVETLADALAEAVGIPQGNDWVDALDRISDAREAGRETQ